MLIALNANHLPIKATPRTRRSSVRENQRTCHNRSARVDRYSNRVGTNPAGGNAAKRIITKIKCQPGTIDSGIWNPV